MMKFIFCIIAILIQPFCLSCISETGEAESSIENAAFISERIISCDTDCCIP